MRHIVVRKSRKHIYTILLTLKLVFQHRESVYSAFNADSGSFFGPKSEKFIHQQDERESTVFGDFKASACMTTRWHWSERYTYILSKLSV